MTRDIERRDFLALCGLGVLGAQTVMDGASEPAEDSEPVVQEVGVIVEVIGSQGSSLAVEPLVCEIRSTSILSPISRWTPEFSGGPFLADRLRITVNLDEWFSPVAEAMFEPGPVWVGEHIVTHIDFAEVLVELSV